ncbi:hypothetical protein MLP_22830 [Microlunatus phosphovorus NM-1]|uniref:Uncharacterized protein n=2 Tax=Microlunatus phosphovorus TaxID=29405 RepID=F5XET1_MICPN|nr:hypothetical protein MLP_22830 [Microlunatus phosphovorus NM-1]
MTPMPIQINEVEVVPPPPPPAPPAAPRTPAAPGQDVTEQLAVWLDERTRLAHRLRAD